MKMERFEVLVWKTPECNDFRKLGNGDWVAYSTVLDDDNEVIKNIAPTIREALEGLRDKLY